MELDPHLIAVFLMQLNNQISEETSLIQLPWSRRVNVKLWEGGRTKASIGTNLILSCV